MLAQCGIWVEGVTDRQYLRAYLNAYQNSAEFKAAKLPTMREDTHFAFWEYAGSNLSHYLMELIPKKGTPEAEEVAGGRRKSVEDSSLMARCHSRAFFKLRFLSMLKDISSIYNPPSAKLLKVNDSQISTAIVLRESESMHELAHVAALPHPDQHPVAVYLASLAPGSRRCMKTALNLVAATLTSGRCDAFALDWSRLRYQHAAAVRAALAEKYAPASVNQALAAMKGVLKACWRLELIDDRDYNRAVDVPGVKNQVAPRGRAAASGELRVLFAGCADGSKVGARDAALLALAYGCGLRRAEVVALDFEDYNVETGELLIRRGKGNKARTVYVAGGAHEAVAAWLLVRGEEDGPLLWPVLKGGNLVRRRLSPQTVRDVLHRRVGRAGIKSLSPHDLRRTFISDLLEAGADISTVQKLAGHANVATTTRYDRRGEGAKRKAASLLHVPFRQSVLHN